MSVSFLFCRVLGGYKGSFRSERKRLLRRGALSLALYVKTTAESRRLLHLLEQFSVIRTEVNFCGEEHA
jgi:hypothetical protein